LAEEYRSALGLSISVPFCPPQISYGQTCVDSGLSGLAILR